MTPPELFVEKLDREFNRRLRIRWSHERSEWHIEQKIRRGLFPGERPSKKGWDETTDAYIRHRDGVIHVLSVRTGTVMNCPICNTEMKVPYMVTHYVHCPLCKMRGFTRGFAVVHFPLGDALIDYLRRIDPDNPISERLSEDLDRQNEALAATMEQDAVNQGTAAFEDDYRRIVGIPTTHLSGSTKMWKDK